MDVNLKDGEVKFRSTDRVSQSMLEPLFKASGFSVSGLVEIEVKKKGNASQNDEAILEIKHASADIDKFKTVIEAVGEIAADKHARLVIEGPKSLEIELLKPLLMGRQEVYKV